MISIKPIKYNGVVEIPSSKSYFQRAVAIASLCEGTSKIYYNSICDDVMSVLSMSEQMGGIIKYESDYIEITGNKEMGGNIWNAGESGLGARMYSALAAYKNVEITIKGKGSVLERPMTMVKESLTSMGVDVISRNGYLPLTIKGSICPGVIKLDGSQSSQFVTGVLIVAPLLSGESHIKVTKLQSKPYIEMTLLAMQHFGIRVRHSGFRSFYVVGNQSYKSRSYFVEGDWSAAAFHLVGGAISGEVYLKGLNVYSAQGDRSILPLLKQVGADIEVSQNQIVVRKGKLCSFSFDASDCPDLFPPLVILAAACNGKSIIKGVQRLFNKECDRAEVLKIEMSKIGIRIEINGDFMYVYGGKQITGGVIYSHNDHRIAMAGAIAATIANDTIYVDNHECVQKSYPSFFSDLETITTKRF